MNSASRSLTKDLDFTAVSQLTIEDHEWLDSSPADGRATRIHVRADQSGGACAFACLGVRRLEPQCRLGLFSLVGRQDHGAAVDMVDHLRPIECSLVPVEDKRTNRSRVSMTPDGQRQIVRLTQAVSFETDLEAAALRTLKSQIARARSALVGHLPAGLTAELLDWGRHVGTYTLLCPGQKQFGELGRLRPHAVVLNLDEARVASGSDGGDAEEVFARLVALVAADHLVVMTAGNGPVHAYHRPSSRRWHQAPSATTGNSIRKRNMPCGCGDVLAGTLAFLLGLPRRLVGQDLARAALSIAQSAATAHYHDDRGQMEAARTQYLAVESDFHAGAALAAARVAA